jgi:hypothetical protein
MRTLNDYFLTAKIEDISTAGQVYVAVPDDGKVIKVFSALNGAIATGDATLTVKTAQGSAGTITVTQSGSAAGDVDTVEPTSNNSVVEGETIEIETDGASTNTVSVDLTIVVRR